MTFNKITNLDEFNFMVVDPLDADEDANEITFSAKLVPETDHEERHYFIEFFDEEGKPQACTYSQRMVEGFVKKMWWVQPYEV